MLSISSDNLTYQTEPGTVSLFARFCPSLSFYASFLGIVMRSSRKARKGVYGYDQWGGSSVEILRQLERVGVRLKVSGIEHVRAEPGPVLFIGNHLSVLETMILPALIVPYKPVTFVVKQSLLEYPVFKHIMQSRNPIAVSRNNPRQDLRAVLDQGQERLAQGISIIVFPQTTRAPFDPGQFSTIGVKLARKAGVPVVPLALLTDAWGNGKRLKDFGRIDPSKTVHFAFGEPLAVEGKGTAEHQAVIGHIQDHLARWNK